VQRLSGAVASSIFSDLISGALRPGEVGPPPASERAINALPCCKPPPAGTQCSVCLQDVENDATMMPCGHYHHAAFLTKWLRSHNTCPVCRSTVEADETPRPASLSALLQGWRGSRARAETSADGSGAGPGFSEPLLLRTTAPSVAEAPAPPSEEELLRLSTTELKQRLRQLGVDTSAVVEKRELQDLLRRHSRDQSSQRVRVQVHMEVLQLPSLPSLLTHATSNSTSASTQGSVAFAGQPVLPISAPAPVVALRAPAPSPAAELAPLGSTSNASQQAAAAPAPAVVAPLSSRRRQREPPPAPEPRETRQRTRRNAAP